MVGGLHKTDSIQEARHNGKDRGVDYGGGEDREVGKCEEGGFVP